MKVVQVAPELIADLIAQYLEDNPRHVEGSDGVVLHVAYNSWRAFTKKVGVDVD